MRDVIKLGVWTVLRAACIALAAPHVYPPWPPTVSLLPSVLLGLATIVLVASAGLMILAGAAILVHAGSPYVLPILCADAFALCRWW